MLKRLNHAIYDTKSCIPRIYLHYFATKRHTQCRRPIFYIWDPLSPQRIDHFRVPKTRFDTEARGTSEKAY